MYKRKIEEKFLRWKEQKQRMPLLVKGPRQVGKTTSILDFARKHYEHVIYINFDEMPEYKFIFEGNLDMNTIITNMSVAMVDARFVPGKTIVILDELQNCPNARTSLKFFAIDARFDVIASGSLLGINYKEVRSYPVGYETVLEMHSFDFEEFLWAIGYDDSIREILHKFLEQEKIVPTIIHNKMMDNFKKYIMVGGMPRSIDVFIQSSDMNQVLDIQKSIVENYLNDIAKYAPMSDKTKARACFLSIPKQLSKENKKFQYNNVAHNARSREYEGSLMWLYDAGIISYCHSLTNIELPLEGNALDHIFKVYMRDTGLLMAMLEKGSQADILKGNLGIYKGAIFENIIGDIFYKMDRKLYYYKKNDHGAELDFIIRYKGKCIPIEVKATNGNAKSMKQILDNDKFTIPYGIKLMDGNVGRNNRILSLPLYMAFLLDEV